MSAGEDRAAEASRLLVLCSTLSGDLARMRLALQQAQRGIGRLKRREKRLLEVLGEIDSTAQAIIPRDIQTKAGAAWAARRAANLIVYGQEHRPARSEPPYEFIGFVTEPRKETA